ncbi:MAG: iron-containing alcohol dehydrogenase [Dermatophilaceae bacterium]
MPTRVVGSSDAARDAARETATIGTSALVLLDSAHVDTEVGERLTAGLDRLGVGVAATVVVEVPVELSALHESVAAVRRIPVDVVVALGGGSTIDLAKITAAALTTPSLLDSGVWDVGIVELDDVIGRPPLPTVAIPTTASTGSEVNGVAAVHRDGLRCLAVSNWLLPSTAILDGSLLSTLSRRTLLSGVVESVARVLAPFVRGGVHVEVVDRMALELVRHLARLGSRIADGDVARPVLDDLLWTVCLTGTQLAGIGRDARSHSLWYLQTPVATAAGVDKGTAMSWLLPAWAHDIESAGTVGRWAGSRERLSVAVAAITKGSGVIEDSGVADHFIAAGSSETVEGLGAPNHGAPLGDLVSRVLARWEMPGSLPTEVDLSAAAAEAFSRWLGPSDRRMLQDVATITRFFEAAVRPPALPGPLGQGFVTSKERR